MKKVQTRYCGLSWKGNEHKSHVIMKEWMQETVVKCVFFSRVNDDWYRHVIIVIISIASCSVHMHASSLPQAAPNYPTYRSANAPGVLCLRCWCVEERYSPSSPKLLRWVVVQRSLILQQSRQASLQTELSAGRLCVAGANQHHNKGCLWKNRWRRNRPERA